MKEQLGCRAAAAAWLGCDTGGRGFQRRRTSGWAQLAPAPGRTEGPGAPELLRAALAKAPGRQRLNPSAGAVTQGSAWGFHRERRDRFISAREK